MQRPEKRKKSPEKFKKSARKVQKPRRARGAGGAGLGSRLGYEGWGSTGPTAGPYFAIGCYPEDRIATFLKTATPHTRGIGGSHYILHSSAQ